MEVPEEEEEVALEMVVVEEECLLWRRLHCR